jgi:para-aminobenzoate synthetase component I
MNAPDRARRQTPFVEELIPCPQPWQVARKLAHLPHLVFLDSSDQSSERGRYSYVMADPISWVMNHEQEPVASQLANNFRAANQTVGLQTVPNIPPFQGGHATMLGYELCQHLERIPAAKYTDLPTPQIALGVYDWVVSFDLLQGRAWLVSTGFKQEQGFDSATAASRARQIQELLNSELQIEEFAHRTTNLVVRASVEVAPGYPLPNFPGVLSNFSREGYMAAVQRAVEYVHAGDIFQVNLSQRLLAPLREHPLELYGRLRAVSPSPFGCYLDLGDFQIVSASPERFLQVTADGVVSTRPIKGTRPRGRTTAEDAALLHDLTTNSKDRAENVMIVDLLRNDIGRVCEYRSVTVPKVCEVESFAQVHHLVSEVRGKLRPGVTAFDLLRSAFPGGSITGAPKVRAMEIIAELEPTSRGPYCGSVGLIGFDGAMDSNILIRTFTAGHGWLQFPVGGGIVADSDPAMEYEETLHKAAGLLRALNR